MRHKLVQRIVEAYKRHAEETGTQRASDDRADGRGRRTGAASAVEEAARGGARPRACSPPRASRTGELGIAFVGPEEIRALKREHLGIDEATDVLSFPIDGRDDAPAGVPRQLGDAVLCPQVVGESGAAPLVHGLLHLLGYDHGAEMEEREERELGA